MKISIFTGNQPRHLRLIERLSEICDEIVVVMECTTVFPGEVADFYKKSDTMKEYFGLVRAAEQKIFGRPRFLSGESKVMAIKDEDLSKLTMEDLAAVKGSDFHVVFGASFIKGPLLEYLVAHRALNIHMGVSPYYRGSSCNFWALYDGRPDMVGATVHLLSAGLDSGDMLFHALPAPRSCEPMELGMYAVDSAQKGLVDSIKNGACLEFDPLPQDKSFELRYSRHKEFDDEVARDFLNRGGKNLSIESCLAARDLDLFLKPHVS